MKIEPINKHTNMYNHIILHRASTHSTINKTTCTHMVQSHNSYRTLHNMTLQAINMHIYIIQKYNHHLTRIKPLENKQYKQQSII